MWTYGCNGSDAQIWRLEQRISGAHRGRYRLVSRLGGLQRYCLDNRGDFSNSERMHLWGCLGDAHRSVANQTFDLDRAGEGWTLTFVRGDARLLLWAHRNELTVNGGKVGQQSGGTGSAAQCGFATLPPPSRPYGLNPVRKLRHRTPLRSRRRSSAFESGWVSLSRSFNGRQIAVQRRSAQPSGIRAGTVWGRQRCCRAAGRTPRTGDVAPTDGGG